MCLIEGVVEGGSTMTRRAERNALRRDRRVRFAGEIRCHQSRHIDQHRWFNCFACERAYLASHLFLPSKASLIIRGRSLCDGSRRCPLAGSALDFLELPSTADRVLDLSGHILLPGLINCHPHLDQVLTRNLPEPLPLAQGALRDLGRLIRGHGEG